MENQSPLSPTPMSPSDEKQWILWTHLSQLAMFVGVPGFVGPLVIWLMKKDQSERIAAAAKEALNFQITMTIAALASIPLMFILVGFLVLMAVGLFCLIFPIIGAMKASEGANYTYPLTIRLVS